MKQLLVAAGATKMADWSNDSLDGHCTSHNLPWSIIDSSAPNAHLAAVLAGFMVSAIVFLLRRDNSDDNHAAKVHAIATFLAGVAVLGLDAYVFGSISSMRPPTETLSDGGEVIRDGSEYICTMVWTQGMAASGMLAVGGVLMVAGLGWTTTQFAVSVVKPRSAQLACLGNFVTLFVIASVVAALWGTCKDYFAMMATPAIGEKMPGQEVLLNWSTGIVGIACFALIVFRTGKQLIEQSHVLIEGKDRDRVLWLGIGLTGALIICGPLLEQFLPQNRHGGKLSMLFAIIFCVIVPYIVFVTIAYSVPGPALGSAELRTLLRKWMPINRSRSQVPTDTSQTPTETTANGDKDKYRVAFGDSYRNDSASTGGQHAVWLRGQDDG
jgi:hypothetical protein